MIINRISDTLMNKMIEAWCNGGEIQKGLFYCESKNALGYDMYTGLDTRAEEIFVESFQFKTSCLEWLMAEA